uniref:Uncharacterized protein n=1 Tax=Musa acuminata subsp. malaccensis TaxID=214687 RepID=A0A804L4K4_MUSAM
MRAPYYEANKSGYAPESARRGAHGISGQSVRQAAYVPYEHKRHPMWLGCGPTALPIHNKGCRVGDVGRRERERDDDGRAALCFPPLPLPLILVSSVILFQNPAIGTRRVTRRSRSGASPGRASGNPGRAAQRIGVSADTILIERSKDNVSFFLKQTGRKKWGAADMGDTRGDPRVSMEPGNSSFFADTAP